MGPSILQGPELCYTRFMTFTGFPPKTLNFLADLTHNNSKTWFDGHRNDYERFVVEPALALITDLDPIVRQISPAYRGLPRKLGGSLMRIYRDVRFSKDKTPYKTNIGIQFRHERAADVHAPGWYVHVALDECFVGAGAWHPQPNDLHSLRRSLAGRPEAYREALRAAEAFQMVPVGSSAVRMPPGFDPDQPEASEIRRKDFLVSAPLSFEILQTPDLVDHLAERFRASAAYMAWLCLSLEVPF